MASQIADYEIEGVVLDDGSVTCLQARRPLRLGESGGRATVWILGPLARVPWVAARARIEQAAAVHSQGLPEWLEAGIGEWVQRPVVWVSASAAVTATLASPPPEMGVPERLRAIAAVARGVQALHEHGRLHGAICPQAVALCEDGSALVAPPAFANGERLVAQVGYPPLAYVDPQLLRGNGGRWSDVWALGATIHQAVSGVAPYRDLAQMPVVQALSFLVQGPEPVLAEMPVNVAEIVSKCLAIDPADRPRTAADVADQLEAAAAD